MLVIQCLGILHFMNNFLFSRLKKDDYLLFILRFSVIIFFLFWVSLIFADNFANNFFILFPCIVFLIGSTIFSIRRFHDISLSGFLVIPVVVFPLVLVWSSLNLKKIHFLSSGDLSVSMFAASVILFPVMAFIFLVLSIVPGTNGPNKYGPDPLAQKDNPQVNV